MSTRILEVEEKARKKNGVRESPKSREDSSCYIIKEQKRKSKDIDVQVQPGIAKNRIRGVDESKQPGTADNTGQHQQQTKYCTGNQRGGYGSFHFPILFCTKQA